MTEAKSMLDALEEAGVGVVSDCRHGECGLCDCASRVVGGGIRVEPGAPVLEA